MKGYWIWGLTGIAGFVMIAGGLAHLIAPESFAPLVPSFLPTSFVLMATGLLQIGIGLAVLWPGSRPLGGLAFALLCAGYMPLHLWDFVRPDPVFAPPVAATVRVLVQVLFIWIGVMLWRKAGAGSAASA